MSKNNSISNFKTVVNSSGKEISLWDQQEVINWLQANEMNQFAEIFKSNDLNGYDLCYLTGEDLKTEFKITNFHDRNLILRNIRTMILDQCI